jgi:hypothetical protein
MSEQTAFFHLRPRYGGMRFEFDDPARVLHPEDHTRLSGQLATVFEFLSDHRWHSLKEIAAAASCSEPSASARVRDLRKSKFGGHRIDRKRVGGGSFLYRLNPEPRMT